MNNTATKIEGLLLEHKGTKSGPGKKGKWTLHTFIVKTEDGDELNCQTFGDFDTKWVGEHVAFEAVHNEKFDSYLVDSDVIVSEATEQGNDAGPVEEKTEEPAPEAKRRGRPKKATTVSGGSRTGKSETEGPKLVQTTDSGREQYRQEAVDGTKLDIESAIKIAKGLKLDYTLSDLVALADRVGRTISAIAADKSKDRRMKNFRK